MPNAIVVNFAAGETSPKSRGRFDLEWYASAAKKLLNWIVEIAGPARFRTGFKFVRQTRGGAVARLIPFQINNTQAYMLEFTPSFMRVYKDGDLLTLSRTTVTAITKANPAVITVASTTNLSNGDEVIITGIQGMSELNGRQLKLAGNSGSTFQLVDPVTGANIDSTSFGAYTSGGTLREVYEIASPYLVGEFDDIQFAQNNTTMYLTHPSYAPRKLTVDAFDVFTLGTYSRTNDPFIAGAALTVNGITLSSGGNGQTAISFIAGTVIDENVIYTFAAVVGTVQINGGTYRLKKYSYYSPFGGGSVILLKTTAGADVDSSAWAAYVSGGTATPAAENPIAVAFYEQRLVFAGTTRRPDAVFGSMGPDSNGNTRYDTFTGGTADDDAYFFALAPVSGQVDYISWARGTAKALFLGTFGGPYRVEGAGLSQPISPTSIDVKQIDSFGCEETIAAGGVWPFYIQRGGTTLRTMKATNPYLGWFESVDLCLNAEQIPFSRLKRVILQVGRPNIVWVIRDDGVLCGMTVNITESGVDNVTGWHRHKIGGTAALVLDAQVLQRSDKNDQLWIVSERTVNGVTRRYVEVQADEIIFPDVEDFYTNADDKDDDSEAFDNAVYRLQEGYVHVDAAGVYNGSDRGVTAVATLTPGATTGTGVAFTASAAVFQSTDVGNELWKKPDSVTGVGSGRAVITAYVSSTQVTCKIIVDFDSVAAIDDGDWYFATKTIFGLSHLEGGRVAVVTDGAVYSDGKTSDYLTVTVTNGSITLTDSAAVIIVGLPYEGFLKTHNLEMGGRSGPAQSKPRNIAQMYIRFLNTLGVDYGTDIYNLDKVEQKNADATMDRPAPVFSGIRKLNPSDGWEAEGEKHVVVAQRLPLPAIVQFIDMRFDTTDDD